MAAIASILKQLIYALAVAVYRLASLFSRNTNLHTARFARLHELTGKPDQAVAPRFFWKTVTTDHSYVIGGNSDREYFSEPRTVARHITEQLLPFPPRQHTDQSLR